MTTSPVDLSQLAIERPAPGHSGTAWRYRRNLVTRYLIPAALLAGFLGIVAWAARDSLFPPLDVQVVPVTASQDVVRATGTPLFNAAGWIEPRPTAIRVPGLAPGVVESLLVVEDQEVRAGEAIAELVKDDARLAWQRAVADRKLREAELVHARAARAAAETRYAKPVHLQAQLAEAEMALATIQTELANLPFELQRAESRLALAESDYRRNIAAGNSVSRRELEEALTRTETMQAMVDELQLRGESLENEARTTRQWSDAVREQLRLLVDEIQARDQAAAQVAMAQANLEQREVAVAEAQLQLDRMTIRAPVDGRILRLVGPPGTRIGGMSDQMNADMDGSTVVTMYRPDRLQVKVDVRFEDIPQVQLGQPVRIDNPALEQPLSGTVLFISSEADIQKNTLEVKVAIDSPAPVFKPEMLVDVTFLAAATPADQGDAPDSSQPRRLFIPQDLITDADGSPAVWIADRAQRVARRRVVRTGEAGAPGMVEITSGLDLSSRLISRPPAGLKDGTRIRITGEAEPARTNL